jgi:hypothetical protein
MTGFTQVFSGGTVQPANQLYVQIALTVNTTLVWPTESAQTTTALGDLMDITPNNAGLSLQLPNAQQGSQGLTSFINNLSGTFAFNVIDAQGNVILTSQPGTVWMIYLASNTTVQGVWRALQFGAQSGSVNVAALAGAGLQVVNQALAQAMPNVTISTSYASSATDLATTFIWDGGTGTFTLPLVGNINSSWFVKIVNAGSGNLTVTPQAGTIDNASTKQFAPGGTGFVFTDGTNFWSLGYGLSGSGTGFGYINLNLPASGTYTISGAQLNQISYLLTGALTANVTLVVPASVQQYWINNQTTGGFLVTVESASPGTTVNVAQGSQVILYCDGTNIITAVTGTALPITVAEGGTGAVTAASARTNLGFSSVGSNIGTAATQALAQTAMGAGALGAAVFTATGNTTAWAALVTAGSVANGLNLSGGNLQLLAGSSVIGVFSPGIATFSSGVGVSIGGAGGSLQILGASAVTPVLQVKGNSGIPALTLLQDGQTGQRQWLTSIGAFTGIGNYEVTDQTAGLTRASITTGGQVNLFEPSFSVGALSNAATASNGSFTGTLTGCTTSPQGVITWVRVGPAVILNIPTLQGTSNSTSKSITGLPASLVPATGTYISPMLIATNGGSTVTNMNATLGPSGVITYAIGGSGTGFTASGTTQIFSHTLVFFLF